MSTYVARIDIDFYRQTQPYGERKRQAIPTDTAMSSGGDGDGASNDVQIRRSEGAHEDKLARYHRIGIIVFVTMVLCFVFVAILFLLLHFYFKYVQRRQPRHRRAAVHTGIASEVRWTQTPEPVVIATLPSFPYRTAAANRPDGSPQPLECVVCLSTVEEGEMVKVMPNCKHTFHEGCIDMWLHSQTTCPICRTEAAPATTTVNGDHEVEAREASVAVETPEICGTARLERRGSDRDVRESSTASAGRLGASLRPILMTDTSSRTQNEGNEDLERR